MVHHTTHTTTTRTGRRNIFGRRRVVHHQKRHATLGDKISGALMKLKGTLTRRPGQKVRSSRLSRGAPPPKTSLLTRETLGCRNSPHARHRRARLAPPRPRLVNQPFASWSSGTENDLYDMMYGGVHSKG